MTATLTVAQPLSAGDVLRAAADLLEKPGAWTQGAYAKTAKGFCIGTRCAEAACRCVLGAIWAVDGEIEPEGSPAARALGAFIGEDDVAYWNDLPERTQAEVVATLRAAAESAAS